MFQKYKYVLAVYEEGCFTKAADKLFISQPSLSVAVSNIEKKIGSPLFERCGRKLKLTEIGHAYITAAQKMQNAEDVFLRQLEDLNGLHTGKLAIGGSNFLSSYVLPKLISKFRSKYPGIEITLIEANSLNLRELLLNEEVDLVIDNFEDCSQSIATYPLIDEHILLCVPTEYKVNESLKEFQIHPEKIYTAPDHVKTVPALDLDNFREIPFVLLKNGNDMHERANNMFKDGQITPKIVFSVDQLNISYALAESGLGACFITDTFFKYGKHMPSTVLYKLKQKKAKRKLHIVYKNGRYCTKAMQEFIKITQETVGGFHN
ncbi:MAG: LysR family transcriptional regulator [Clostridia bacterium]|nr:LysR family transcriptional regulator [Clostridia bacterium]